MEGSTTEVNKELQLKGGSNMKSLRLVIGIIAFAILIPEFSWGYEDPTPPADWIFPSHTVNGPVTRGENADYEIIWTGEISNCSKLIPDPKAALLLGSDICDPNNENPIPFCIGIIKYLTHAFEPGKTRDGKTRDVYRYWKTRDVYRY